MWDYSIHSWHYGICVWQVISPKLVCVFDFDINKVNVLPLTKYEAVHSIKNRKSSSKSYLQQRHSTENRQHLKQQQTVSVSLK